MPMLGLLAYSIQTLILAALLVVVCLRLRTLDLYLSLIHISEPTRLRRISYAVFWMLAETCFQLGIKEFDLSGIDPVNNRGVYDFKKGTGADQIDFQGEWEIASPKILRTIASKLISRRVS